MARRRRRAEARPGIWGAVIVYVALGLWGEYALILPEVYRRAVAMGLGTGIG